jgi:hypothetical protein
VVLSFAGTGESVSALPPMTPLHLSPRLFLGRQAFTLSERNLRGLNISHVLLTGRSDGVASSPSFLQADLAVPGVLYYTCDRTNEESDEAIRRTYRFALCVLLQIQTLLELKQEQQQQNPNSSDYPLNANDRILVQLQGRSSSLTGYDNLSAAVAILFLVFLESPELLPYYRANDDLWKLPNDVLDIEIRSNNNRPLSPQLKRLHEKLQSRVNECRLTIAELCGARFAWEQRHIDLLMHVLLESTVPPPELSAEEIFKPSLYNCEFDF